MNAIASLAPGLHRDIPMADYLAMDGVSASLLHVLASSTPAHARVYMTQPREDTTALIVGEAAHYAILEPELFGSRYLLPPDVDRRTKDGKAEWAAFVAANPSGVALVHDEYHRALAMAEAVRAHSEAGRYLYGRGLNEVTALWDDDGIACKARPDRVAAVDEWTWIVDVKTCRSASPHGFAKAIADYGYHQKAAWYVDALNALDPRERRFLFVAVEKEPPFAVALYELTDEAIGQGRAQNAAALATYRECRESGVWPGYPSGVEFLDLPKWAQLRTE